MHFQNDFSFVAQAPMGVAAPLFGANRERVWAPDWNPVFLWPRDVADQPGMVFTVDHGDNIAVWVNGLRPGSRARPVPVRAPGRRCDRYKSATGADRKCDPRFGQVRAHGAARGRPRRSAAHG